MAALQRAAVGSYQSLGSAVQGMPVVPPELGVGALQRGVPLGLRLLDAVVVSRLVSEWRRFCA